MATVSAIDQYGPVLTRGILREEPSAAVVMALQTLLETAGAGFSVVDVAAEIGAMLPAIPVDPAPVRMPRRAPSKSRAA